MVYRMFGIELSPRHTNYVHPLFGEETGYQLGRKYYREVESSLCCLTSELFKAFGIADDSDAAYEFIDQIHIGVPAATDFLADFLAGFLDVKQTMDDHRMAVDAFEIAATRATKRGDVIYKFENPGDSLVVSDDFEIGDGTHFSAIIAKTLIIKGKKLFVCVTENDLVQVRYDVKDIPTESVVMITQFWKSMVFALAQFIENQMFEDLRSENVKLIQRNLYEIAQGADYEIPENLYGVFQNKRF